MTETPSLQEADSGCRSSIFSCIPFYYVDYAMAQIGAFEFYTDEGRPEGRMGRLLSCARREAPWATLSS